MNSHLNLSFEQAEKLKNHEETIFDFTNIWDKLERNRSFMESILNQDQYQIYVLDFERMFKNEEDSIIGHRKNSREQINYLQEQKEFTKNEFVPRMTVIREEFDEIFKQKDKTLVNEVIKNYRKLITTKRNNLNLEVDKHTRGLNPEAYIEFNLRLDLDELIPTPRIFEELTSRKENLLKLKEIINVSVQPTTSCLS